MISAVMTQTNIREGVKSTAFLQYIHTGSIYSIKYWYIPSGSANRVQVHKHICIEIIFMRVKYRQELGKVLHSGTNSYQDVIPLLAWGYVANMTVLLLG